MPPGGRRGEPVTKRRKRLWSLLSSSEITSRKYRMAVLSDVYLHAVHMHETSLHREKGIPTQCVDACLSLTLHCSWQLEGMAG